MAVCNFSISSNMNSNNGKSVIKGSKKVENDVLEDNYEICDITMSSINDIKLNNAETFRNFNMVEKIYKDENCITLFNSIVRFLQLPSTSYLKKYY